MLFTRKKQSSHENTNINNNKINNSSQTSIFNGSTLSATTRRQTSLGRAALFIFSQARGSLTVEAAFILPFFLFLSLMFVFFCQIFLVHQEVQGGLLRAARNISENVLVLESILDTQESGVELAENILAAEQARRLMVQYSGETLNSYKCLNGGVNGLKFYYSSIKDGYVDLVVFYRVSLPYSMGINSSFPVVQRCRMKAWTGSQIHGAVSDNMVYITSNGTVYHKTKECSHIKLQIRSVGQNQLSQLRNNYGAKYKACDKCALDGSNKSYAYITGEGDRYHNTLSCSGLKRSVHAITKEAAEKDGKSACKRCCF